MLSTKKIRDMRCVILKTLYSYIDLGLKAKAGSLLNNFFIERVFTTVLSLIWTGYLAPIF